MQHALLTFVMVTALSSSVYGTNWNQLGSTFGKMVQQQITEYLNGADCVETHRNIDQKSQDFIERFPSATDEERVDFVRASMPFLEASLRLLDQSQHAGRPHDEVAWLRDNLEDLIASANTLLRILNQASPH